MGQKPQIETRFERGLFASRWLMAPMYLGLIVSLAMLVIVFARELIYYAPQAFTMTSEQVILVVLTLIDLSLAGNLLLIVLFSGYENFVSKIEVEDAKDWPEWMGKIDYSGMKLKLVASIVAKPARSPAARAARTPRCAAATGFAARPAVPRCPPRPPRR